MRIISQDGCYDVPYEQLMLLRYEKVIYIMNKNFSGVQQTILGQITTCQIIAEYSTEEKAIKAMEMCREKYLSRMELDGGYDIMHEWYVQPNYWVLPRVFQFPKDEEVE